MEKWFLDVLKNKYADFEGRARRKEYWMFTLFQFIILAGLSVLSIIGSSISGILGVIFAGIYLLAALGLLVPSLAIFVRRLHDTGRSGWFILLGLIPLVSLILLVFACLDSQPGDNQYGPNPKGQ
ncbi:MAG: DUF805 domain-containing protein [Zoogloeaceae bacterium]|jgi:uncharacterized membrane protein YhaH (DUF805 family)|nr:DUF805 domain-containing protein [Zoogloeaceae bacterium]